MYEEPMSPVMRAIGSLVRPQRRHKRNARLLVIVWCAISARRVQSFRQTGTMAEFPNGKTSRISDEVSENQRDSVDFTKITQRKNRELLRPSPESILQSSFNLH